jgi:hypothetical protein
VESLLDVCGCPADIHEGAVWMRAGHVQAIGFGKGHHRLIILPRRPKPLRELSRRQVLVVSWTGRVVELPEQAGQPFAVAQRQHDHKVQPVRAWQWFQRAQAPHCRRHAAVQLLPFRRRCSGAAREQRSHADQDHKAAGRWQPGDASRPATTGADPSPCAHILDIHAFPSTSIEPEATSSSKEFACSERRRFA